MKKKEVKPVLLQPVSIHQSDLSSSQKVAYQEIVDWVYSRKNRHNMVYRLGGPAGTGKAQPDLETLERIAAAMGVAVTEVIYGAAAGPNLGRLKRKWAALGGMMVAILAILIIICLKNC